MKTAKKNIYWSVKSTNKNTKNFKYYKLFKTKKVYIYTNNTKKILIVFYIVYGPQKLKNHKKKLTSEPHTSYWSFFMEWTTIEPANRSFSPDLSLMPATIISLKEAKSVKVDSMSCRSSVTSSLRWRSDDANDVMQKSGTRCCSSSTRHLCGDRCFDCFFFFFFNFRFFLYNIFLLMPLLPLTLLRFPSAWCTD